MRNYSTLYYFIFEMDKINIYVVNIKYAQNK